MSKTPRCFKNMKNLPVRYSTNKKSLLEAELRSWDWELQTSKRKTILQTLQAYCNLLIREIVESIEKKQDYTVTLLDAIQLIEKAWRRVTTKTIQNYFQHAGILLTQGLNGTENEGVTNNDDDLPLTEWLRKVNCNGLGQYNYEAYATIYDDIVTMEAQTDDDFVSEVKKYRTEDDAEEEDEEGGYNVPKSPHLL
ncbi:hypothetical protein PR048_005368 [Dryococelus australis]|uniref:DDE-1 domain-containing protein n=1 Tax=Dryococelus australis TaxID=614101 RepID=A0ABQ9I7Z7_9NEOP|nr:hypothetical protein PR048_005368 [Dryococelus australis]